MLDNIKNGAKMSSGNLPASMTLIEYPKSGK